jgi:hypothetical protein
MKIALWILGAFVAMFAAAFAWYKLKVIPSRQTRSAATVGLTVPGGGLYGPYGQTMAPSRVNTGDFASQVGGYAGAIGARIVPIPGVNQALSSMASGTVRSYDNIFSGHGATRDWVGAAFPMLNQFGINDHVADAVNWTGGAISDAWDSTIGSIF